MTARNDFDRQMSAWLVSERPNLVPEGLLEAVVSEVGATARRPGWRIPDRWTWRHSAQLRSAARLVVLVGVVAALVLLLAWIVPLVGSPRPAPPFGLANAGFIAFDSAEGIVLDRADGTDRHVIVRSNGQAISPTWSRDGLHLAFWTRPGTSGLWSLAVVGQDGSGSSVLVGSVSLREREASLSQPSNLSWSPDSRRIAFAGDVKDSHGIFVATLGQTGATLITDPTLGGIDPAWSPDGSVIAFQSEATGTLHVIAPDGTGEHRLAALANTFLWPDWSPDGSFLATGAGVDNRDGSGGQTDIFVVSANGTVIKNMSKDPADEFSPSWSPDGSRLAWARIPKDGSARAFIVVARPDGPNVVEIRVDADLAPPVWAPDGTRLYSYVTGSDGKFHELVVIDPEGVAPVVRLPAEGNTGNGNWQRLP
jgi:Tol biopolymer transport system component